MSARTMPVRAAKASGAPAVPRFEASSRHQSHPAMIGALFDVPMGAQQIHQPGGARLLRSQMSESVSEKPSGAG